MNESPAATFRKASLDDVVPIGRMLKRFWGRSGGVYRVEFDYESTLIMIADVTTRGVCLIGPQSCAGAQIIPFPYNRNVLIAHVIFWYARRGRQLPIFDALRHVCGKVGAHFINASSLFPANSARRFYEDRGLWAVETQFLGLANRVGNGKSESVSDTLATKNVWA